MEKQLFQAASAVGAESRAERILAEYLRAWGLRHPATIAEHCHSWARQVTANRALHAASPTPGAIPRAAVGTAIGEIDQWLDALTRGIGAGGEEMQSRRGLLAIELQTLVDKYPAALLAHDSLPPSLVEQLRRAARRVVPVANPRPMPAHELGQLASPLQWSWWSSLGQQALSAAAGMSMFRRPSERTDEQVA